MKKNYRKCIKNFVSALCKKYDVPIVKIIFYRSQFLFSSTGGGTYNREEKTIKLFFVKNIKKDVKIDTVLHEFAHHLLWTRSKNRSQDDAIRVTSILMEGGEV